MSDFNLEELKSFLDEKRDFFREATCERFHKTYK